jgi:hypothetical protein
MPRPTHPLTLVLLTGALVGVPATSATADLTVLPSPPPSASVPLEVPVLPDPSVPTPLSLLSSTTPAPATTSAPAQTGLPVPRTSLPPAPALPMSAGVPGAGGGEAPSDGSAGSGDSGTRQGSPVGDDVLPAALEAELCMVLTALLGPLPAEVKGIPAGVVARLPAQITDLVPADVLATVTLQCPAPAAAEPAAAPAEVRSMKATAAKRPATTRKTTPRRATSAGLSALPHTGLVAALPLVGASLLVAGFSIRRRFREQS